MGVTGLWKLLEPSGKPVPLETLENKVLAVDISIWLHQVVKGFQDNKGNALAQAHLLGLFHRLCKLLYYKIKPVFVFDGATPMLKKDTIAKRQMSRNQIINEADRLHALLLQSLAKEKIVQQALGENATLLLKTPSNNHNLANKKPDKDDMFKLPELPAILEENSDAIDTSYTTISTSDYESTSESSFDDNHLRHSYSHNLQSIDVNSAEFKNLPADVRHEILSDIKESRKQSSWNKLHELPAESNQFSSFQMKRLLRRRQVQVGLEEAEKEMGGRSLTLSELRTFLAEEGIVEVAEKTAKQVVISDENTRFLLVRDLAKGIELAEKNAEIAKKEKIEKATQPSTSKTAEIDGFKILNDTEELLGNEYDKDLQLAIQMSLTENVDDVYKDDDYNNCKTSVKFNKQQKKSLKNSALSLARNYMIEYGGMNDVEVHELLQSSQIGEDHDDELSSFMYNKSIVSNLPEREITDVKNKEENVVAIISSDESDSDNDLLEVTEQNILSSEKKIEINIDATKIDIFNDKDDIFADVFNTDVAEKVELPHVGIVELKNKNENVISIETEPVEDKKDQKLPTNIVEILENLKKEASEISKISLDDIKLNTSVIEIKDSDDEINKYEQDSKEIIEIPEDECHITPSKRTGKIGDFFETEFIVKRTPEKALLQDIKSPVKSPFFVKKSPRSSGKRKKLNAMSDIENGEKDSPKKTSKVAKMLFEEDLNELAAKTLRENKGIDELQSIARDLNLEKQELEKEKNRQERMGMSITEKMNRECMELLRIFGIPYIVAPMEAEAQCAFLNNIHLTDGTITDDSDIWLFGGQTVYKNFFNQKKLVYEYKYETIEKLFNVDRYKLIQLAMLVGSDYTIGINGIGSVTALEILATFARTPICENGTSEVMSTLSSLRKFRDWWKTDRNLVGSASKISLKNKLKNIEISEGFPNIAVVEAYLKPKIDEDREKFTWGSPDTETLHEFTKRKFGWTRVKTDEILKPVLKKIEEKVTQKSIMSYFNVKSSLSNQHLTVSKRVQKAINKMAVDYKSDEEANTKSKERKTRKKVVKKTEVGVVEPGTSDKKPTKSRKRNKEIGEITSTSSLTTADKTNKKPRIPETKQNIPQREKDLKEMDRKKKIATEIFKKSKK